MVTIEMYWITGEKNPADIQIKFLPGTKFHKHFEFLMFDHEHIE